jgi:hypothetical protein
MKKGEQSIPAFFRTAAEESTRIIKRKPRKQDEDVLVQIAETDGWEKVKEIIGSKKSALDEAFLESLQNSTDLKDIGIRALIKNIVGLAYDSVIDSVELPLKARNAKHTK